MVTLTAPGYVPDPDRWNGTAAHRFNRLMVDIRSAFAARSVGRAAPPIEYVRKAEMQARGLVHYHVLAVEWGWLPVEVLRALAVKHGFGPRVQLERPRSVGAMSAYFVKSYLAKQGPPLPLGMRAIVYSQGWPKVYRERSADPVVLRRRVDDMGDHESWESWSEVADRLGAARPAFRSRRAGQGTGPKPWERWTADTWSGP